LKTFIAGDRIAYDVLGLIDEAGEAGMNLEKLNSRKERGRLQGDGNNR
jgi:hypothetical protein